MDKTLKERLEKLRKTFPRRIGVYEWLLVGHLADKHENAEMNDRVFYHRMGDLLTELEDKELEKPLEVLLDLFNLNRLDKLYECYWLYENTNHNLYLITKFLDLIKSGNIEQYYNFCQLVRDDFNRAIIYLEKMYAPVPQRLSDIQLEDTRLDNLLRYTAPAGLSFDQMQELNKKHGEAIIETEKSKRLDYNKASIEIAKTRSEHDETIRFEEEKKIKNISTSQNDDVGVKVDYHLIIQELIKQNIIARDKEEDADGNYPLVMWDERLKCYRCLTRKDESNRLFSAFKKLTYAKYGYGISISDTKIEEHIKALRFETAPTIEDWELIRAKENQIFFGNGYYDFDEAKFCETDTKKYLHYNSIVFDYNENASAPSYYDEMINGMFDDEDARKLAKQIHGALLFEGNLKSIFILQGVSQGGKSTYAEVPIKLLPKSYVQNLTAISDIDASKVHNLVNKARILYIDDAPNKPLNPNTVSYMKSCSRGVSGDAVYHKIMIGTNHALYSEKGTASIEEALGERVVVLPFKKNFKEIFEKGSEDKKVVYREIRDYFLNHFEEEKQGIVREIIAAFQEVYDNDKIFKINYTLNGCVASVRNVSPTNSAGNTESENFDTDGDMKEELSEKERRLSELIDSDFDFTDDEEYYMRSEDVFKYVDEKLPQYFGRKEEVGKALIKLFGDSIKWSKRKDNKTWYKIKISEDAE